MELYLFVKEIILKKNNLIFSKINFSMDQIFKPIIYDFKKLREALIKLFAVDIMMGQYDRNEANIWIQENKDGISLAPVFDYSASLSLIKYLERICSGMYISYDILMNFEYIN